MAATTLEKQNAVEVTENRLVKEEIDSSSSSEDEDVELPNAKRKILHNDANDFQGFTSTAQSSSVVQSSFESKVLSEISSLHLKINCLQDSFNKMIDLLNEQNIERDEHKNVWSKFPCGECDGLRRLETLLIDPIYRNQIIRALVKVGGESPAKFAKRSMNRMFTCYFGSQCSWDGTQGKVKIMKLNIIATIMEAARTIFPISNVDIEVVLTIRRWLERAKEKYSLVNG